MKRIVPAALSLLAALTIATYGQAFKVGPVRVSAGTVLTFYLHARLNTASGDGVDGLPKGTLLRVKMLDSIDSAVNGDGTEFHGTVVSGLASSGEIVIHPDSEVRGILALLRSRSHPDGFRYELLITSLTDHGKSYVLTASLRPSLTDSPVAPPSNHGTGVSGKSSESGTH
jgi:hypothetical protein